MGDQAIEPICLQCPGGHRTIGTRRETGPGHFWVWWVCGVCGSEVRATARDADRFVGRSMAEALETEGGDRG